MWDTYYVLPGAFDRASTVFDNVLNSLLFGVRGDWWAESCKIERLPNENEAEIQRFRFLRLRSALCDPSK